MNLKTLKSKTPVELLSMAEEQVEGQMVSIPQRPFQNSFDGNVHIVIAINIYWVAIFSFEIKYSTTWNFFDSCGQ